MRALMLVAVLSLAACGQQAATQAPVEPAAPPAASSAAQPSTEVVTAEGWGPLRIGMSTADVIAAVGNAPGAAEDPNACREFHPANAPDGIFVMLQDGVLARISVREPATIQTDRGFGIGATAAAITAAYGANARTEPHKYEAAPAQYITAWTAPRPAGETYVNDAAARGVRYEVGTDGTVKWIRAGGPSIQLVESCS